MNTNFMDDSTGQTSHNNPNGVMIPPGGKPLPPLSSTSDSSLFTLLPSEVKAKIFSTLPLECIKIARLVCTTWCDIIDSNCDFSVVINDRKLEVLGPNFPSWKIEKCLVTGLMEQNLQHDLPLLSFPSVLSSLSIWGNISVDNFRAILFQANNLKELNLANQVLYKQHLFKNSEVLNLSWLCKLMIFSNVNVVCVQQNLIGLFQQSITNLAKLTITIEDHTFQSAEFVVNDEELEFIAALGTFISRQEKLKVLQLSIIPYVLASDQNVTSMIYQLNQRNNFEKVLSKIRLKICRLSVSPIYLKVLHNLISSQICLKDIRFRIHKAVSLEVPNHFGVFKNSICFSMPTLVSINLQWASTSRVRGPADLDLRCFLKAKNLKRLRFKAQWSDNDRPTVISLHYLPESLEDLDIEGFNCSSEEIKLLADTVHSLNSVRLVRTGVSEEFGITGSVIKKLLSKNSVKLVILGPLRNTSAGLLSEDEEYEELRRKFNYPHFSSGSTITFDFQRYRDGMSQPQVRIG